MKRRLMTSGFIAALMAAPIGLAAAADQQPQPGMPGPATVPEKIAPEAAPQPKPKYEDFGSRIPGGEQKGTAIEGTDLTAGDLQDKSIYDLESREVGKVKEVSEPYGKNRVAIVEVGSILGFGGKDVAVPVEYFKLQPDGRLVVVLTEEELKQMPEVRTEEQDSSSAGRKS